MRTNALFAAVILSLVGAAAMADDAPQLTGTWKGKSQGISMKGGYIDGGDVTIVISEQKGRSFKGEITYPGRGQPVTEAIVGTVGPDGDRVLFVGDEGHHIAEYDDGVLQDCYVSDDNSMAVCMELTKQ
jgi:hypothetical protein